MATPYIGFGNETINKQPMLGLTAQCPKCGKDCEIKDSEPPMLQFIDCCGTSYMVGIKGRDISGIPSDVSGKANLR